MMGPRVVLNAFPASKCYKARPKDFVCTVQPLGQSESSIMRQEQLDKVQQGAPTCIQNDSNTIKYLNKLSWRHFSCFPIVALTV